jgi:hypothetical protein
MRLSRVCAVLTMGIATVSATWTWSSPASGASRFTCGYTATGHVATIIGTPGNDRLVGTKRHDVIVGRGGDDVLIARGSNDRLCGGNGDDELKSGRTGWTGMWVMAVRTASSSARRGRIRKGMPRRPCSAATGTTC